MNMPLLSCRLHLDTAAWRAARCGRPDIVDAIERVIHQIDNPPAPPLPAVVPLKRALRRSIAPQIEPHVDIAEAVLPTAH